jgi:hypothetical protein
MAEELEKIDSLERLNEVLQRDDRKAYELIYNQVGAGSLRVHLSTYVDRHQLDQTKVPFMDTQALRVLHQAAAADYVEVNEQNFWIVREAYRFATGLYQFPMFVDRMRDKGGYDYDLFYHFPHVSLDDPTMMAYTPSLEYGLRDRQVRIKVGRYLAKYYGNTLSQTEIRYYANGEKVNELCFAETADEIERVYVEGPGSCMGGKSENSFDTDGIHPARVYEGEFKLAYLEECEEITARALVHEPTMTYVRTYGHEGDTLAGRLNDAGYSKAYGWDGARVKAIRCGSGYIMPYLDGSAPYVHFDYKDRNFFIITSDESDADFEACNQNGLADSVCRATCSVCGDSMDEDNAHYSEYHDVTIGECCIDDYTWAIYDRRGSETYVADEYVVHTTDGQNFLDNAEVLGAHNYVQLDNGDWAPIDDAVETVDGDWVLCENAVRIESEDGDDLFYSQDDWKRNPQLLIQLDAGGFRKLYDPDSLPSEIEEEVENQPYIDDGFGNMVPTRFITIRELAMFYDRMTFVTVLSDVGFDPWASGARTIYNAWQDFKQKVA